MSGRSADVTTILIFYFILYTKWAFTQVYKISTKNINILLYSTTKVAWLGVLVCNQSRNVTESKEQPVSLVPGWVTIRVRSAQ